MRFPLTNPQRLRFVGVFLAGLSIFCVLTKQARSQTETVLYTFTGLNDGGVPYAGLVSDKQGNLYGTALQYGDGPCSYPFGGCGTVFELTPVDDGGNRSMDLQTALHIPRRFGRRYPSSDLVFDSSGNLYGTATWRRHGREGPGCGTVFELERSGNEWVEKILYRFTGESDGEDPVGSVTLDSQGDIYGTTAYGGDNTCYFDNSGPGCGVVFQLSPPGNGERDTWPETVLHTFEASDGANPYVGVTLAPAKFCGGAEGTGQVCIFGTATNGGYGRIEPGGVVFQLVPTETSWTYRMIYEFPDGCGGPGGPLILDKSGALYGMAHLGGQFCSGVVFSLQPDAAVAGSWLETNLYSFTGPGGAFPLYQGLVMDKHGNLYSTTGDGGDSPNCQAGCGTVFRLTKVPGGGWYESGVYSMQGGADGLRPLSGNVVVSSSGEVYGMTPSGGNLSCTGFGAGCGVIYRIGP